MSYLFGGSNAKDWTVVLGMPGSQSSTTEIHPLPPIFYPDVISSDKNEATFLLG